MKRNSRNKRLGRRLTQSLVGFSEAGAGSLLGYSGTFVGDLKEGVAEFTSEIVRHLADRLPEPYGAFWRRLAQILRKFGGH